MQNLSVFYGSLITMVLLVLLGIFLGKRKFFPTTISKPISNILLMVAMPAALFKAFPHTFDSDLFTTFIQAIAFAALAMGTVVLLGKMFFSKRRLKEHFNEHRFAFIFSNASYVGYPLVLVTFGDDGLILMPVLCLCLPSFCSFMVYIYSKKDLVSGDLGRFS